MRALVAKMFLTFGSVCVWANGLSAQSYKMTANIPFAFHVKSFEMRAGTYTLYQPINPPVQFLRSATGKEHIVVASGPQGLTNTGKSRLVFHAYGNQYFLSEVWTSNGRGTRLSESKDEKTARESQSASLQPREVTVFLASL